MIGSDSTTSNRSSQTNFSGLPWGTRRYSQVFPHSSALCLVSAWPCAQRQTRQMQRHPPRSVLHADHHSARGSLFRVDVEVRPAVRHGKQNHRTRHQLAARHQMAMPAVIIMTIWKDFGYATVLYLAGLMNLPRDVYEAAAIDDANSVQIFFKITMPLPKSTTLSLFIHVTDQLPAGIRADSRHDRRRSGHVNLHHQLSHL